MVSDALVEEVRARADLVELCGEFVTLKRVGKSFRGPCPIHGGEGPNFSVDPARGFFKCFVCGEGGDVFALLMRLRGYDFPTAVRHVANRVGVEIPETEERGPDPHAALREALAFAEEWFVERRKGPEGEEARQYLRARGFDDDAADRYLLGFAPDAWRGLRDAALGTGIDEQSLLDTGLVATSPNAKDPYDRFRNRLIFSIRDLRDRPIAFGGRWLGPEASDSPKYINSPESPVFEKGRTLYPLNLARHEIRRHGGAIVVEGFMDALALHQAGFENAVAPLGTALTHAQAQTIARYGSRAILAYDSDAPGLRASFRAADQLLMARVHPLVLTLPEGEDPDSVVLQGGAERFRSLLDDAMDVLERKLKILRERGYLETAEGRRRALDGLLDTLRAVRDPALRDIYIGRAAESTGVRRATIVREIARARPRRPSRKVPPPADGAESRSRRAEATTERNLLLLLLRDELLTEPGSDRSWIRRTMDAGVRPVHFRNDEYRQIYEALVEVGGGGEGESEFRDRLPASLQELVSELLADSTEFTHPEEIYDGAVARLRYRPAERRLREIHREMEMADETTKRELLREQVRIRAELPVTEKTRLSLVLPWLEGSGE